MRFLIMAFALGAALGLITGVIFGGDSALSGAKISESDGGSDSSTSTSGDSSGGSSEPMTPEKARAIGANEMGQVLVLMYHHFGPKEAEWTRTPENFRKDIELLKAEGFYPINARDLAAGNIDIPAGKSPVVITFDDSSPGQYRILEDGTIDPDSAVGIMQQAVKAGDWASRASFFCLLDVVPQEREIFGQDDRKQEKLKNLVDWGYEVGSHTVTHLNLKEATPDEAVKQLAESQVTLESLIGGGYAVTSIAIPYGEYPADDGVFTGEFEGQKYTYTAGMALKGTLASSPFSSAFDPLRIPRIRGSANYITQAIADLNKQPGLRYVSDGDPTAVSAPKDLAESLGAVKDDLGRPIIRY